MIEQALLNHLSAQTELTDFLATYAEEPAVFNQEAPADTDAGWASGPQYGRIVFAVDIQGDPERTLGGTLVVDIMCKEDEQIPEDIEPIIRKFVHGYFFSNGIFTVAAQFKNSNYFTQPTDHVTGCTVSFDLLAFPVLTTNGLNAIARLNEWTSEIGGLYVINHDELPAPAWKPGPGESAVYWRCLHVGPSGRIRDRYATIWRTATIKGHIFSEDLATANDVAEEIIFLLYADKRILKTGESPIMVDDRNTLDNGADPLKTGQVTVEATYGINRYQKTDQMIQHIHKERKETL
jgi:hypothetical protein